jgi:flagellum-specific ATP synthase
VTPVNVDEWRARVMDVLNEPEKLRFVGRVTRVVGLSIEAILPACTVGASCSIQLNGGGRLVAEIVGFRGSTALLMPIGEVAGVRDGAVVELLGADPVIPVGDAMLGRVLGPMLEPMDGGPALLLPHRTLLWATPPVAMRRADAWGRCRRSTARWRGSGPGTSRRSAHQWPTTRKRPAE